MVRLPSDGYFRCAAHRSGGLADRGQRVLCGGRICPGKRARNAIAADDCGASHRRAHRPEAPLRSSITFSTRCSSELPSPVSRWAGSAKRRSLACWNRSSCPLPHSRFYAHAVAIVLAFVADHVHGRDPGRGCSQVHRVAAHRARRARRRRPDGLLHDRGRAVSWRS